MFVPRQYQPSEIEDIYQFIEHNAFANLVSTVNGKFWATHLPLMLSKDRAKLHGHVSRANQQWKFFEDEREVMAIFNGPHSYISSSWYDHENVPTWNYIAVHIYGTVRLIEGEALLNSLKELTDKYEKKSKKPVSVEGMREEYLKKEIKGLVGFEIQITDIQAAWKLSQNRDKKNYLNIISELEQRHEGDDLPVAEEMKKNISRLYTDQS
jgi:transcriptional regulator